MVYLAKQKYLSFFSFTGFVFSFFAQFFRLVVCLFRVLLLFTWLCTANYVNVCRERERTRKRDRKLFWERDYTLFVVWNRTLEIILVASLGQMYQPAPTNTALSVEAIGNSATEFSPWIHSGISVTAPHATLHITVGNFVSMEQDNRSPIPKHTVSLSLGLRRRHLLV